MPKVDRALLRFGCLTLAIHSSLHSMEVLSTREIAKQRECYAEDRGFNTDFNIKKLLYCSQEAPLSPVQLSSQHFRESLVAEWQQFTAAHQNANISSNLKFGNAYDGFKQSIEFDNLITLLKDVNLYYR